MDMQPDTKTTGAHRHWTREEDEKLTSAVTSTRKKKRGKKYITNWGAITALVPGRTEVQCRKRWHDAAVSKIDPAVACKGKWTADEDEKLKNAVPPHGGKVERSFSVATDGIIPWILVSARRRHMQVIGRRTKTRC
jgi:hypothetical protein